jgi:hypothetical protein
MAMEEISLTLAGDSWARLMFMGTWMVKLCKETPSGRRFTFGDLLEV